MKAVLTLALTAGLSLLSFNSTATILPENDLHLEDNLFSEDANMTEADFNRIIDEVMASYSDIVTSHGGNLETNKLWNNSTVNASAQQIGSRWVVNMYGGLARRPEVTEDGFALVVCHELGHHLAGFPFYGSDWAASEGESDYFATQACARRVWGNQHEKNALSRETVKDIPRQACDMVWQEQTERDLCYRAAMGGESLAKLLAALGNSDANFGTPDRSTVPSTRTSHPKGQCRLDTYFEGALCSETLDPAVIPGRRHPEGQQSLGAETEAAKYSCTRAAFHAQGLRPRCWYKPNLQTLISVASVEVSELSGNGNGALEPNETASVVVKVQNLANKAYNNVVGTIASVGNKFEVLRGESNFETVDGKSSKTGAEPFEIKVGDLTCGEEFEMDIRLNLGDGKEARFTETAQVGKLVNTEPLAKAENKDIPDNDRDGLNSVVTLKEAGTYAKAAVTVDIDHTYRGDLTLKLLAPNGNEFMLVSRKGGGADNIKETFEVDLPTDLDAAGNWTLNIVDSATRDTGKLNKWEVMFTKSVCE